MISDVGNFVSNLFKDQDREEKFQNNFLKYLLTKGKRDWESAKEILRHADTKSNPKITHAEALGIMLNYILLITKKMGS